MRRKTLKTLLLLAATTLAVTAGAQKIRLKEGSLETLKNAKKMNLQFRYDSMTVTTTELPEDEFIKTKTEEYNGKGHYLGTHLGERPEGPLGAAVQRVI